MTKQQRRHRGNQDTSVEWQREQYAGTVHSYTPLQMHFLTRLADLVRKREALKEDSDHDEQLLRLCNRAIYATYRDCMETEVGGEARAILEDEVQGW